MAPKKASSKGPNRSSSKGPKRGLPAKQEDQLATLCALPAKKEDPLAALHREAEEIFERYEAEGNKDGVLKLKEFADIVRGINTRKCMIWGDDPCSIIKREWSNAGGREKRELNMADFKAWWPKFMEAVNVEAAEKVAAEQANAFALVNARAEKYGHDGVWHIGVKDLQEAAAEARKKGKTPLIIDNTEGLVAEKFYLYSGAHVIECKKMIMEKAHGKSVEDILEEERRRFFSAKCFKFGQTAVFRLSTTAANLKSQWNSDIFPSVALLDVGQVTKCFGDGVTVMSDVVESSPFYKMAPEEEALELSACGINEKFNVVVITHFQEEDYEEFLKEMIPLHLLQPIRPTLEQ